MGREFAGRPFAGIIAASEQERRDATNAAESRSRERLTAAMQRARELGFTERQAPFAAAAVLTRGSATAGVIRRHLQATHPQLFEEDTQCPT